MIATRVLYVEDDERLARLTSEYLRAHGFDVHHVARGDEAVNAMHRVRPDVVLLDLMLPGIDGMEICRTMRAQSDIPIILVTARNEIAIRGGALEAGAVDYVSKPFQSRELLARIRAQVGRARGEVSPLPEKLIVGELVIDGSTREVTLKGESVSMTTSEFDLLAALAQRPGRVLTRNQLLDVVCRSEGTIVRASIDGLISELRNKLETDPTNPRLIRAIRDAGFMLTSGAH